MPSGEIDERLPREDGGDDSRRGRAADPGVGVVAVLLPVAAITSVRTSMPVTHLTLLYPYICGITTRAGPPCGRESGPPSISRASITSGSSACSEVRESSYGASSETKRSDLQPCLGRAVAITSSRRTPAQRTSDTDQPVTQWKSETCSARGEGAQVGERERRRALDVAGDAQSVVGRRDAGHARSDRVDAPPARWDKRLDAVGDDLADEAEGVAGEEEPGDPGTERSEESRASERPIVHAHADGVADGSSRLRLAG